MEGETSHGEPSPAPPKDLWRVPRVRAGALLLAVGSLQFFVAMAVEQALRPGYYDVGIGSNTISDLGVNIHGWSYAWIFDSSIILLGIMAILGVVAIFPVLPRRWLAYSGAYLLALGSFGAICVGIFTEQSTAMGGRAHDYWSVFTFMYANVGLFILGLGMWGDRSWGRHALLTILLGLLSTVALGFYIQNELTHGIYLGLGEGGLERIVAFPVLLWALFIGAIIWRRGATGSRSRTGVSAASGSGSAG